MVQGIKFWNDKSRFYSQENNAVETYNKTQKLEGLNHWTESCGPTAAINIIDGMNMLSGFRLGIYAPQAEDMLWLYMNDPKNSEMWEARKDIKANSIPGNRVPQFYPRAVRDLFAVTAQFYDSLSFSALAVKVAEGSGVQICLKKPGHYIAIVAYDVGTNELIYNDSFGSRFSDGLGGFNRRLTEAEFKENTQGYAIVYVR